MVCLIAYSALCELLHVHLWMSWAFNCAGIIYRTNRYHKCEKNPFEDLFMQTKCVCGFIDAYSQVQERAHRYIHKSTGSVTNSGWRCAHSKRTNIIAWSVVANRKTSFRDKNGNYRCTKSEWAGEWESECVWDMRYPYHGKLHCGTDLVHGGLSESNLSHRSPCSCCSRWWSMPSHRIGDNAVDGRIGWWMIHTQTQMSMWSSRWFYLGARAIDGVFFSLCISLSHCGSIR